MKVRFGMISSADSKQPSQLEESNLGSPPPPLVELQSELCYLCLSGGFPGIVLLAECTSVLMLILMDLMETPETLYCLLWMDDG